MDEDKRVTRSFGKPVRGSLRRNLSGRRMVAFIGYTALVAGILYIFVISGFLPRPLRIVSAGGVFAFCLVGSIIYGIPWGALSAIANLSGAPFTVRLYQQTGDAQ